MNILDTIIAFKRKEVAALKERIPARQWENASLFSRTALSLEASLNDNANTGIIAEFKRKSPSKGIINDQASVSAVTDAYARHGAAGISVLTDQDFFGGSNEDLLLARENQLPLLRKDFIIDEYQLLESKAIGADVILLIAACLTQAEVKRLASFAKKIGLEVLLELHAERELEHICEETGLIGVNNRNLQTFEVDIERSLRMAEKIPSGKIRIAESGIDSIEMIRLFQNNGFRGFLIGENFMKAADPARAFEEFTLALKNEKINSSIQ